MHAGLFKAVEHASRSPRSPVLQDDSGKNALQHLKALKYLVGPMNAPKFMVAAVWSYLIQMSWFHELTNASTNQAEASKQGRENYS